MQYRTLGKTNYDVSTVSFGAWAVGGSWGKTDDSVSLDAMRRAVDLGVTFIDTADVYGDGHSERLIATLAKERPGKFKVATKAGRRLNPHVAAGYTPGNIEAFVDRSLKNLQADALDLVQLHCPPTDAYYRPELFAGLERLRDKGKVRQWGVSVEKVEEALKAIEYDVVATVQIIFNCFRLRPAELFFEQAKRRNVGVIVRVPLASGTRQTQFAADDHRNFNRHGQAFDVGETFSGVEDLDAGLAAVDELKQLVPPNVTLAQFALRWILMFDAVSCTIPGAKRPDQVEQNCAAADLPPLTDEQMRRVRDVYDRRIKPLVHHRW
jgi:aryl-alcohol dehydrogenase-like predicted oxidoreductase